MLGILRHGAVAAALILALSASAAGQSLPTPDEFAGFPIGSDGNLVRWERIVDYFGMLEAGSDRVRVEELGKTVNGNPFILATITSPANMARLEEIRATQRRLAHPAGLTEEEIERLAWSSPAVVLITCNIHATEIAASQAAMESAHRLATEESPWMRHVLDNVVFLLVPSFNPDGQIMVVDWNNRVKGTENVWAPLPYLYHPYVGHDNNRDAYMMTQPESRYVNKVLFQDWFPQVYLDEHQMGQSGMRVFVPPFANPINPNVDPAIWSLAGQLGLAMYQKLYEKGFTGVGYDQRYTAWWQGGFLRGAWFHNMVGMLTEVASANLASPIRQEMARLGEPRSGGGSRSNWIEEREKDPLAPMPPPTDVMPRYNYPRPWLGGEWKLRDVVDAQLTITYALLEQAANDRVNLIRTQARLGLEAIAEGEKGGPWAYVFPAEQHDPSAAYRLLEVLEYAGVEVERATAPFLADGREYGAGSYVIRMAQPFRAYAKDMLEPQYHPDPGDMPAGAMADQPYDLTAWSLPLQMGVEAVQVTDRFDAALERLDEIPLPEGRLEKVGSASAGYLIAPESNNAAIAANRLLKREGVEVSWIDEEVDGFAPGSLWVRGADDIETIVSEFGLRARGVDAEPPSSTPLRLPRTALYRPWTASMDEGWTRWLLEQYEFPFSPLFDADVRAGGLVERWDAILLPGDRSDSRLIRGASGKEVPREYRGGIGEEGRKALREFVARGGTLVVWGDGVDFALETFELPLHDALAGVPRSQFSCPGAMLNVLIDPERRLGYGMQAEAVALFDEESAFEPIPGFSFTDLKVVARYPASNLLASGWIRGERFLANRIAAAEVGYRKGRVVLIGFRPQFRAQPHNTFKLLFNAIRMAAAEEPGAPR